MKTLLNTSTLSDGTVSIPMLSSLLQPIGAKGVIYNVPLDITVQEIQECLQSLVRKKFKFRRDTTNEYFDSQTVLFHFTSSQLPEAVKIGYLNLESVSLFRKPRLAMNATALVKWQKIAEARTSVQSAAGIIVRNIVPPLLHNVQTATVSTRLVIGNAPNIAGSQKFSKLELHPWFPMPRLADYTANQQLLSIHKPHLLIAQENFHRCLLSQREIL